MSRPIDLWREACAAAGAVVHHARLVHRNLNVAVIEAAGDNPLVRESMDKAMLAAELAVTVAELVEKKVGAAFDGALDEFIADQVRIARAKVHVEKIEGPR